MEKKSKFKLSFFELALVLFFIIETNYAWGSNQIRHWGCIALLAIGYIVENKGVINITPRDYSKWSIGVLIMAFISLVYTIDISNSVSMIKNLVVVFFAFFLIRNYATDDKKINFVLNAYLISSIINCIYILSTVDMSVIGETRIGNENMNGWNSNTIGVMASNAAVIGIYMIFSTKKFFVKLVYLVFEGTFLYVTVYSGSRKAFVIFVICMVLMLFLKKPKAVLKNTIIISVVFYAAFYVCMNVESVYTVLGTRMEGLISGYTGEGEVDNSTEKRLEYIENGVEWIEEAPIIGYGVNSYRLLNGKATGDVTYSHNNFIEMTINWGVIGFAYYYSIFLVVGVKLRRKIKGDLLATTVFVLFIVNTIMHYGMVTYYEIFPNIILCLACAVAYNKKAMEGDSDVEKIE